jgi:hypothetical protein
MKLKLGPIAAPLFFELGVGMAVGMLGTSFAAHISDAAGGAFALTNHLFGLLFMVFRLVGAGIGVVVSQNLGAQHRDEADRVARAALAAGTWMGGSMALVALLFATPLLRLLNAPADASFVVGLATRCMECLYGQRHAGALKNTRNLVGHGGHACGACELGMALDAWHTWNEFLSWLVWMARFWAARFCGGFGGQSLCWHVLALGVVASPLESQSCDRRFLAHSLGANETHLAHRLARGR